MRPLALGLLAVACAACGGGASQPAAVRLDGPAPVRIVGAPASLAVEGAAGPVARFLPGGLGFETPDGRPVALGAVREAIPDADGLGFAARLATATGPARLRGRWRGPHTLELELEPPPGVAVGAFEARLALRPGEAIWGLTERAADAAPFPGTEVPWRDILPCEAGGLDRRGARVEMWVRPTISIYAPFYQSSLGYGLLVEGTMPGWFDVGRARHDELRLRFEAAPDARLRLVVFLGTPAEVTRAYAERTGHPRRPPDWAFRHWIWHDEHRRDDAAPLDGVQVDAQVAEDVHRHDELGLPAGVYLFDRPWARGPYGFGELAWDEAIFPNPGAMLDRLRARGWRTLVWSAAFAVPGGALGREARAGGFLAPRSERVLDLTSPGARALWRREHLRFLRAWPEVDGIKLDRGEEGIASEATDTWADGRSGREVRNAYPLLQLSLYQEILRQARGDDFVLVARASWTGGQRYGQFWGGDIAGSTLHGYGPGTDLGLRQAILAMLRVGFLGIPFWGSDIGGYAPFRQREVFARWLEVGTFSPLMEIGGIGSRWPWAMGDPPQRDEELVAIYRDAILLRHALLPYLVRQADAAARTGRPIARALAFDHPQDPRFHDLGDAWMLGDDLLVAPVWRVGQRERSLPLPPGVWEDFYDPARRYQGPATVRLEAPLARIPVLVRAGARVPGRPPPRAGAPGRVTARDQPIH